MTVVAEETDGTYYIVVIRFFHLLFAVLASHHMDSAKCILCNHLTMIFHQKIAFN